jgi:hypothetical protein
MTQKMTISDAMSDVLITAATSKCMHLEVDYIGIQLLVNAVTGLPD